MVEEQTDKNIFPKLESICLFSFLLMCFSTYKIFLNTRTFPLCPIFEWLPSLPTALNFAIAITVALLIIFNNYFYKRHILYISILIGMAVLTLFDINRLSPFGHTYYCFFFVFIVYYSKTINAKAAILFCQLILIGIYIGTGIHKINPYFIENIFKWWLEPFRELLGDKIYNFLLPFGWLIGFIEVAAGLFLLFAKTRKLGLWLAMFTHAIILISYSPPVRGLLFVGLLVYNFSLMWLLYFLFNHEKDNLITGLFDMYKRPIMYLVTFVFIGLPILHIFTNKVPTYMAYDLYGGRYRYTYFIFDENTKNKLPSDYQFYSSKTEDGKYKLFMESWALYDCRAGMFRQEWVFKHYKKEIEKYASKPSDVLMVVNRENREDIVE